MTVASQANTDNEPDLWVKIDNKEGDKNNVKSNVPLETEITLPRSELNSSEEHKVGTIRKLKHLDTPSSDQSTWDLHEIDTVAKRKGRRVCN